MLVVTLGDPHGIGIELIGRCRVALLRAGKENNQRTVLLGSRWQFDFQLERLGLAGLDVRSIESVDQLSLTPESGLCFLDTSPEVRKVDAALLSSEECGEIAVNALMALRELQKSYSQKNNGQKYNSPYSERLAVVTAPIDKKSAQLAGWRWGGQTEFFEELWQSPAIMILAGPKLKVALATNHMSLERVTPAITQGLLIEKLDLLALSMRAQFGIAKPRIAVCGLNPHASDGGLFGTTEAEVIAPAIAVYSQGNPDVHVTGPLPADTIFYRAMQGQYDVVLAMYHDQGLGPLKTVHFDDAINLSGGLPHLRVSPDHGPAKDLYLTGQASIRSFEAALNQAGQYLKIRQ